MKTIFSNSFLSLLTRKDAKVKLTKYFITDCSTDIIWNSPRDLVSKDIITSFQYKQQKIADRDVVGVWEENSKVIKLVISLEEDDLNLMFDGLNQVREWRLGYFYYKDTLGDEDLAFILVPDNFKNNSTLTGSLELSTYGNNLIEIEIPENIEVKSGNEINSTTDISFLEGPGAIIGENIFKSSVSPQSLVSNYSFEKYLVRKNKNYKYTDVIEYLGLNGEIEKENSTYRVVSKVTISLEDKINIDYDTKELVLKGNYTWQDYSLSENTLVQTGVNEISSLDFGEIIVSGSSSMIDGIDYSTKTIYFKENNENVSKNCKIYILVKTTDPETGKSIEIKSNEIEITQGISAGEYEINLMRWTDFSENHDPLFMLNSTINSEIVIEGRFTKNFYIKEEGEEKTAEETGLGVWLIDNTHKFTNLFEVVVEKERPSAASQERLLKLIIRAKTTNLSTTQWKPYDDELPSYTLRIENDYYKFYVIQRADIADIQLVNSRKEYITEVTFETTESSILEKFAITSTKPLSTGETNNWSLITTNGYTPGSGITINPKTGIISTVAEVFRDDFWERYSDRLLGITSTVNNTEVDSIDKGYMYLVKSVGSVDITNWKTMAVTGFAKINISVNGVNPSIESITKSLAINKIGIYNLFIKSNTPFEGEIINNLDPDKYPKNITDTSLKVYFKETNTNLFQTGEYNLVLGTEVNLIVEDLYSFSEEEEIELGYIKFTTISSKEEAEEIVKLVLYPTQVSNDISTLSEEYDKGIFLDISERYNSIEGNKGTIKLDFLSSRPVTGIVTTTSSLVQSNVRSSVTELIETENDLVQRINLDYNRTFPNYKCPINKLGDLNINVKNRPPIKYPTSGGATKIIYPIYPIPLPPKITITSQSTNFIYISGNSNTTKFDDLRFTSEYRITQDNITISGDGFEYMLREEGVDSDGVYNYVIRIYPTVDNENSISIRKGSININSYIPVENFLVDNSSVSVFNQAYINNLVSPDNLVIDVFQYPLDESGSDDGIVISGNLLDPMSAEGESRILDFYIPEGYELDSVTKTSGRFQINVGNFLKQLTITVDSRGDYFLDLPNELYTSRYLEPNNIGFTMSAVNRDINRLLNKTVELKQEGIPNALVYRDDDNLLGTIGAFNITKRVEIDFDQTSFKFSLALFSTENELKVGDEGSKINFLRARSDTEFGLKNCSISEPIYDIIEYSNLELHIDKSYNIQITRNSSKNPITRYYEFNAIDDKGYTYTFNLEIYQKVNENIIETDRDDRCITTFHSSGNPSQYLGEDTPFASTILRDIRTNKDVNNFRVVLKIQGEEKEYPKSMYTFIRTTSPDEEGYSNFSLVGTIEENRTRELYDSSKPISLILMDGNEELWRTYIYQGFTTCTLEVGEKNNLIPDLNNVINLSTQSDPIILPKDNELNIEETLLDLIYKFLDQNITGKPMEIEYLWERQEDGDIIPVPSPTERNLSDAINIIRDSWSCSPNFFIESMGDDIDNYLSNYRSVFRYNPSSEENSSFIYNSFKVNPEFIDRDLYISVKIYIRIPYDLTLQNIPGVTSTSLITLNAYLFKPSTTWLEEHKILAESIELSVEEISFEVGDRRTIIATVLPENTTDKTIIWYSNDEDIATVDENGEVVAKSVGETMIIAQCGEVSVSCNIIVRPTLPETIILEPDYLEIIVNDTATITPTVLPIETTDKTVTWTSQDESIATVDEEGNVTGISMGNTTIVAQCGEISAICTVNVVSVPVESIELNQETGELRVGEELTLVATVLPENATVKTVLWSSDDENIATVNSEGNVLAISLGTVTITATSGSISASCIIDVVPTLPENITLDQEEIELKVGESALLTATILPEDATDKSVIWSSDDEEVAIVDEEGNITALQLGSTFITATTSNDLSAICQVEVTEEIIEIEVTGISLSETEITLTAGETTTLEVTVEPENATNIELVWSSEDEEVATVNESGEVTAVGIGETSINVVCGEYSSSCLVKVEEEINEDL